MRRRPFGKKPPPGFVLLEVIIAMTILGIVLSSLAAMLFQVSRHAIRATGGAYRNGILLQEVNRLEALPFDSLALGTTSVVVSAMPYPHTATVTIALPKVNIKSVKVVIAPAISIYKKDSALFIRTNAVTTTAFDQ